MKVSEGTGVVQPETSGRPVSDVDYPGAQTYHRRSLLQLAEVRVAQAVPGPR